MAARALFRIIDENSGLILRIQENSEVQYSNPTF